MVSLGRWHSAGSRLCPFFLGACSPLPLFLILYHCDALMVPAQAAPLSVDSAPKVKGQNVTFKR